MQDILIGLFGVSHSTAIHFQFIVDGIIGGILYVLVMKYGWKEFKGDIYRRIAMGAIAGHLVFIANWPNSVTAMSLGYFGIDAIESIMNRFNKTSYQSKKKKKFFLV